MVKKTLILVIFAFLTAFAQEPNAVNETEPISVDEAESALSESIPANIATGINTGKNLARPVALISMATIGLGAIIYGIVQDSEVAQAVKDGDCKCAVDAKENRNIGYAIGTTLLASGITFYFVF